MGGAESMGELVRRTLPYARQGTGSSISGSGGIGSDVGVRG